MNQLQLQVAQCQDTLRRCELEKQQQEKGKKELDTKYRQLVHNVQQVELARRQLALELRNERAEKVQIQKSFEIHEASRVNTERQVSESWRTISNLSEFIHTLRLHLDGSKLSPEEKAVDVAGILMQREQLRIETGGLKNMLFAAENSSRAASERFEAHLQQEQLAWSQELRARDHKIGELERALARVKQDSRKPPRLSQKKVTGA